MGLGGRPRRPPVIDDFGRNIMTTDTSNPLLDFSGLPRFDQIAPEHVTPAIEQLIGHAGEVVRQLEAPSETVTWESFVMPLEEATERLGRAWGVVNHLNHVMD